jgi:hypothetical protein
MTTINIIGKKIEQYNNKCTDNLQDRHFIPVTKHSVVSPRRFTHHIIMLLMLLVVYTSAVPTYLWQHNFENGTIIIDVPGEYILGENISFNPNRHPFGDSMPRPEQFTPKGIYDPATYGIGFFAAIVIMTDWVQINLNGFILEQSTEHALMQRFFSLIELAPSPFLKNQGPHDFTCTPVDKFQGAQHVEIYNGTLGRSSHHSIHGNNAVDIFIHDIVCNDFEIACIHLNGGKDIVVKKIIVGPSRKPPVTGLFSAARFILPYIKKIISNVSTDMECSNPILRLNQIQNLTAVQIYDDLSSLINETYKAVVIDNMDEMIPPLVRNIPKLVDASSIYGLLFHSLGVAINDLSMSNPSPAQYITNITIEDVSISGIQLLGTEIVARRIAVNSLKVQIDPVGTVFDFDMVTSVEGTYISNPVANAQLLVTKYKNCVAPLSMSRNSITFDTIKWAEGINGYPDYNSTDMNICGGDIFFHVNKGVFGIRIDVAINVILRNISITNISNKGLAASRSCGNYYKGVGTSHPKAIIPGYRGADSTGIVVSRSSMVSFEQVKVSNILSFAGTANGIWIVMNSYDINGMITIDKCMTSYAQVVGEPIDPIIFFKDRPQQFPTANYYSIDNTSESSLIFITPEKPSNVFISPESWSIYWIILIVMLVIGLIGFMIHSLYRYVCKSYIFKKDKSSSYIVFKNPLFGHEDQDLTTVL